MRLVATPGMGVGEFREACGKGTRLVHAANKEQGLTQLGEHKRLESHPAPSAHAFQYLVQEREGLGKMPGQGICRAQDGGDREEGLREVGGLAERQAPFKQGDCSGKRPLAAAEQPNPRQRNGKTEGLLGLLSCAYCFFSHATPLGKVSKFGQAPGYVATGDHGRQGDLAEARITQLAGE